MSVFQCNKIFVSATQPDSTITNKIWYNPTDRTVKVYNPPDGWVVAQNTDSIIVKETGKSLTETIANLKTNKENKGELWFGGGTFTTSQKVPLTSPFSYVWTWAITSVEWANIPTSSSAFLGTHSSWAGEGFVFVNMPTYIIWRIWSGGVRDDTATIMHANLENYLDGNPHVWAIINDGTKLNLYIDGTLIKSTAAHNWTASESTGGFSTFNMSSVKYKMSRIAGFSFDMSAQDAPYTVADYQNGVDVPPNLRGGQDTVPATVGPNAWTETPGVITPATGAPLTILGGVYTWTRSAAGAVNTYSRYFFQKKLSAGAAINSQFTGCYLFYTDNTKSTAQSIVQNSTLSLTAEKEVKAVEINFRFTSSALENDTLQLDALKIHVNGALLDLENYTYEDGASKKIFDVSGNGNDATITGSVVGTNDLSVSTLLSTKASDSVVVKTVNSISPTSGAITLKSQNIPLTSNITVNGTATSNVQTCLGKLNSEKVNTPIVGTLSSLNTTDKTSVVNAINELNSKLLASVPDPITGVFTASSTSLVSLISDSTKANIHGKVLISPNINNVGAIYVGQGVSDKATAFPLYPNQIVSFSFTDITNFKCAVDVLGDSFNYVVEFGVLNAAVTPAEGLIMVGTNGGQYQLMPSGEAGSETFTITRIS